MTEHTCAVPECTNPVKRKQLCYGHYMKQWRYGTTHPEHERPRHDLEGKTFGELTALTWKSAQWTCQCSCGATATVRTGDLMRGSTTTCGDRKAHHRSTNIGYSAAHDRVRTDRGPSTAHQCVDCGNAAAHWSYDHSDPDEMTSTVGDSAGAPYSTDPAHYSPRCVPCHKAFDLSRGQVALPYG